MNNAPLIQFHPADDPSRLSKVGNWVITYLTDQYAATTQLAITNVIPRQIQDELQARRFIIESTSQTQIWTMIYIECFDSTKNQSIELELGSQQAQQFMHQLFNEFARYDVEATLI